MKKIVLAFLVFLAAMFIADSARAYTVGTADFKKIATSYNYAKDTFKDLDTKAMELQQFIIDKDKQYKAIDSPITKKNFEEKTQKEFNDKKTAIEKLQADKEEEIYKVIMNAITAVANQKQIDVVLDNSAVFVGGIDISDDVVNHLNTKAAPKKK